MSWETFCHLHQIGARFSDVNLKQCADLAPEIIDIAIDWCERPKSLVLHGDAGRGKTTLMFFLVRKAIERFQLHNIRWIKSKHLDDKMVSDFNQYGDTGHCIGVFSEPHVLFLDDFGIERSGERTERDYYDLLDKRWECMRTTVITTNLDEKAIKLKFGDRIYSRLKDSKWVHFDGPDLRGV